MPEWALPVPLTLLLDAAERDRLGLPPGALTLRRARPRTGGHLSVVYASADGGSIVGQWFAVPNRLERVARETAEASPAPSAAVPGTGVLLQARGADRRLTALAPLVAREGATLVSHRPERSAVVRLPAAGGTRYAKVVLPERAEAVAAMGRAARQLAGAAFATPRLIESDPAAGVVVWSGLDGVSPNDLFGTDRLASAMRAVGQALRALHETVPPAGLGTRGAMEQVRGLQVRLDQLAGFAPELHGALRAVAPAVFAALAAASSPPVLLHGDFSAKQTVVDGAGRVGIVDFDALATGEAALDVANALVDLEARAIQGLCPPEQAEAGIAAFLDGYRPPPDARSRIDAYADGARLRLACLAAFRPGWAPRVPAALLDRPRIGGPSAGLSLLGPGRPADLAERPIATGTKPGLPPGASV